MMAFVHRGALLLALLSSTLFVQAQLKSMPDSTERGKFAFVLYAGGGVSYFPTGPGTPAQLETRTTYIGPSGTVRLMWLADRRLRLGFESGWLPFYSYTIDGPGQRGRVELVGVPLLVMWSMPLTKRFSLFAGYGTYRITSKLDYVTVTRAATFSLGYAAAISYVYPINERVGIAFEGKWFNAAETRQTVLAAQVELVWKLHRW